MSNYSELLKHPKWQKKRLEILERDGWKCDICLETEITLHVHHNYYNKNNDPWDYKEDCYRTLCEYCHEDYHGNECPICESHKKNNTDICNECEEHFDNLLECGIILGHKKGDINGKK